MTGRRLIGAALLLTAAGCAHAPPPPADAGGGHQPTSAASGTQPMSPPPTLETHDLAAHMRDDAPLRYVVKPGDTLWDIAARYLADPWYWPQLWDSNPDISNPHRIYPGEVLVLSRGMNGQPRLSSGHTVHLSPRVRHEQLPHAIPTIPFSAIRPFLKNVRVVDADTLKHAPYIVALKDEHLVGGARATAYVRHLPAGGPATYTVVKPKGAYRDAVTRARLGQQVMPVGRIHIDQRAQPVATGVLTKTYREVRPGDRLIPVEHTALLHDFYPRAPDAPMRAHIIAVYGSVFDIGQYDVVTLDRGTRQGMQRGDVLQIDSGTHEVSDPVEGGTVQIPRAKIGELMVFKVADRVSFALVMRATEAIHVGDPVHSPAAS